MEALTGLEIFTPAGATVAALVAMRITGLVWTAPVFSARVVPGSVKAAITVLIVILLWPLAMISTDAVSFTVGTALSEILIGLTLGLGAAIFVAAAESAGDMLAVQMGLSGANVVDPMSETQLPVLGQFLGLFVTSLILASGAHLVILETLSASIELLPIAAPIDATAGAMEAVKLGSTLLWLGLRFAAPVVAAMMIGNAALGVMARTVPQLNVLMVAFPVQIGIGLFVLAATLPLLASSFVGWDLGYRELAGGLLESLTPVEGGS